MSQTADKIAVVVLGPGGMETAQRIKDALPGARIHGLSRRVGESDIGFDDTAAHLRALFQNGAAIVGVCAAGILIRALGPVLSNKQNEPPVVAVAEDGGAAVPLLGGHHGANDMARRIAHLFGGIAAVTTAGDLRFGIALDEPPERWRLANPDDARAFTGGVLAGAAVKVDGDIPWLARSTLPLDPGGELTISATHKADTGSKERLVYHPAVLVAGVGCERGAKPDEVIALIDDTLAGAGLSPLSLACLASIDLKMDEVAINAAGAHFGVPVRFFDAATLEAETPRLANPSDIVFAEVGCHGVAEGAALAAVGAQGTLAAPKHKSKRATCAIGLAQAPLAPANIGTARGRLFVVGTGPGCEEWQTPQSGAMVAAATDLVGYGLYLDLLGPLAEGKTRHDFALGEEEVRVRRALELAGEGKTVALVSSGDPGIYAMATLVFELMERGGVEAWRRLDVRVGPGISAFQAAASRIGAPVNHDFCTISLSDLLTPWDDIETRVRAAAAADFVIAFYNPVSKRRRTQLAAACDILLTHRPDTTPVVLARNLGRPDEAITVTTLKALNIDDVDMLTVVLVGSSETRRIERGDGGAWVYTPRGYAGKAAKMEKVKKA